MADVALHFAMTAASSVSPDEDADYSNRWDIRGWKYYIMGY